MVVSVILVTFISLTFFGTAILLQFQISQMKGYWYDRAEVAIYLCIDISTAENCNGAAATQSEADDIEAELNSSTLKPYIDDYEFETQDEAYQNALVQFDGTSMASLMTPDIFSEAFRVNLVNPDQAEIIIDQISPMAGVEEVDDQRTYLFDLAAKDRVRPSASGARQQVDTQLQRMLDDLTASPAFVIGRRTDILGWNQLAAALWTDFGRYPEQERVFVRLLFTEPWMRELYADWEEVTRLAIAQLRMESARYPDDRHLAALVDELSARDAQFRQWWNEHDVAARGKGTKKLCHPVVGELTLDWDTLTCATDPEQHIIVWTAAPGSPSHDGLRLLDSWAADQKRTASDPVA
jgi:hypothetical protein